MVDIIDELAAQFMELKLVPVYRPLWVRLMEGVAARTDYKWSAAVAAGGALLGLWAWRRNRCPPKLVMRPIAAESRVEGSEEVPMFPPVYQLCIGYAGKSGAIDIVGCGIRVELASRHFLMTAAHNLAFDEPLYLVNSPYKIKLIKHPVKIFAGRDIGLVELTDAEFSELGVRKAVFSNRGSGKTYVNIVGCFNKGTTGYLESTDVCGIIRYSGTTAPGYSGAAYASGNHVYGIHTTGGGKGNMGIPIMFAYYMALIALGQGEVSEEAYDRSHFNRLKKNRPLHNNVVFVGDFVIVEDRMGFFHNFPKDKWLKYENDALQDEYPDETEPVSDFDDYEEECARQPLNSKSPGTTRAGGILETMADLQQRIDLLNQTIKSIEQSKLLSNPPPVPFEMPPKKRKKGFYHPKPAPRLKNVVSQPTQGGDVQP